MNYMDFSNRNHVMGEEGLMQANQIAMISHLSLISSVVYGSGSSPSTCTRSGIMYY